MKKSEKDKEEIIVYIAFGIAITVDVFTLIWFVVQLILLVVG